MVLGRGLIFQGHTCGICWVYIPGDMADQAKICYLSNDTIENRIRSKMVKRYKDPAMNTICHTGIFCTNTNIFKGVGFCPVLFSISCFFLQMLHCGNLKHGFCCLEIYWTRVLWLKWLHAKLIAYPPIQDALILVLLRHDIQALLNKCGSIHSHIKVWRILYILANMVIIS